MSNSEEPPEAFIDRIEARAYSRVTEIPERVESAILNIFPKDVRDRIRIERTVTEGHARNTITVISGFLNHKRSCEDTLTTLLSTLTQNERKELTRNLSQRLDDKCIFFLRIDKQAAYLERMKLATGLDVISIRIHIRQYPRCVRKNAEEFIRSRLDD